MVHAFIFGTNIFISTRTTVSYANEFQEHEFLNIASFYRAAEEPHHHDLTIDAKFNLVNGEQVVIRGNRLVTGHEVILKVEPKRVIVYQAGYEEPVLDVFQLDESTYHGFGTHIKNELYARQPDAALSIRCDLVVEGAPIWIDSEKMHVNEEIYASGVRTFHHGIILASDQHDYSA